jgi:uncharacterized membrane protein
MRDFLLVLHIVGAAGWLGGGLFAAFAYPAVARSGPPAASGILAAFEKPTGAFFGITSGLVLLSGIGLVITSEAFGWSDTFVLIGIGAFLISGLVQSTVGGKADKRLAAAAESGSGIAEAVKTWRQISFIDIAVLLVVVWAMVTKLGA